MDSPPDAGSRHEFACRECGLPLHEDQAACLSCGAMVENGDGRISLRRAVASSATILLLLGGAVGAAIAGLPNGKRVSKGPIAQVFGGKPPVVPPATVSPSPGSGTTTPLPSSTGTTKPPSIPHRKATTHTTTTTPTHASSLRNTNTSSSGSTGSGTKKKKKKNNGGGKKKHPGLTTFTSGEWPGNAGVLAGSPHAAAATDAIDRDLSTAWTGAKNAGIWVQPQSAGSAYAAVGVLSKTPGYGATVYYSTNDSPPSDLSGTGWKQARITKSAHKKERFRLDGPAQNAKYYLVVINTLPASGVVKLNEIQLLP
jgi:hypothetical protein